MFSWFSFDKGRQATLNPSGEEEKLIEQYHRTVERQQVLESLFNLTSDSDMIDYYIHERNALEAHHRYLLRCIKALRGLSPWEEPTSAGEEVYQKLG